MVASKEVYRCTNNRTHEWFHVSSISFIGLNIENSFVKELSYAHLKWHHQNFTCFTNTDDGKPEFSLYKDIGDATFCEMKWVKKIVRHPEQYALEPTSTLLSECAFQQRMSDPLCRSPDLNSPGDLVFHKSRLESQPPPYDDYDYFARLSFYHDETTLLVFEKRDMTNRRRHSERALATNLTELGLSTSSVYVTPFHLESPKGSRPISHETPRSSPLASGTSVFRLECLMMNTTLGKLGFVVVLLGCLGVATTTAGTMFFYGASVLAFSGAVALGISLFRSCQPAFHDTSVVPQRGRALSSG